jgi:hypothetical protein
MAWLLREAVGRKNLGGGMLKAEAVDLKEIPLVMKLGRVNEVKKLVSRMRDRDALDTISEIETEEHQEIDELVFDHLMLSKKLRIHVVEGLKRKLIERQCKSQT